MKKMGRAPFLGTLALLLTTIQFVYPQEKTLPLWPNGAPDALNDASYKEQVQYDPTGTVRGYSKVSDPELILFQADEKIATGTAVVICPGGGYSHLAINKEGYKVAKWFNSLGISALVLKYRMPYDGTMKNKSVGPLQDAQEALRTVRRNAAQWNIDPNKVGIMGFSAGGHLAATLSTHYNDKVYEVKDGTSARPDFSILIYPVISMEEGITHMGSRTKLLGESPSPSDLSKFSNEKQVDQHTPPAFLVHTTEDQAVPVENSIRYYLALKENKVPAEMHLYEKGKHGMGLGVFGTNKHWPTDCENWLRANDWLPNKDVYLFSYFKGNGEDGLHFAYSEDGYKWQSLKNDQSFLTPRVGKDSLMRDPCIIKGRDGNFHMVWTVSWTDKGIGYARSKDLIHWSEQKFIPVMAHEPDTKNTWAPEITYDPENGSYMIYWASTIKGRFPETKSKKENGYNHRMYATTTKDFETFTPTELLYDPGFNVIDASIQKLDDKYIMFLKDETPDPPQKNIKIAYADRLKGPYTAASEPITGDYWAEGPTAIKINDEWVVYFDKYRDHKYGAVRSKDLENWEDISDQIVFPEGTRHGTVLKVSPKLIEQLKKE
ncbi:prolyl oligopeptidase family serine peptidase [Pseudozobellia thermophila]|uniref:Acetyl esterase/lipase n=1 Tax=Pseudozobellia thermophila TaxID=192903 RepID=A0A1M6C9Y2_9FLAO|nr:prolyl oligopeptidase family serine peptidase [Pseudozobellia thermophila]SHI57819.1 Acetyl esterase/lipase [Pseudozobellia thermophila]